MTGSMSPLGGVHDDERMLDQLAARSYAGSDELGTALNAWARRVDADADLACRRVDFDALTAQYAHGLARGEVAEPPTMIRIRASRLMATLGGVGVAAAALGIALANGYQVPGFPQRTPSDSSTSVSLDQQLLSRANIIKKAVMAGSLPKQEALIQIAALTEQATDPEVKTKLKTVQTEVVVAPVTPVSAVTATKVPVSPSDLPTVTLAPTAPTMVTTPAPATTPTPPEKNTSPVQSPASPTKPTDAPSSSGIPSDATTTPAPSWECQRSRRWTP
jgi:hypothetical protein